MATKKEWFLATRPWSFPASTMPALVATSYVFLKNSDNLSAVNWWLVVPIFLGVVLFHSAGNLISDYFDYKHGVDTPNNIGNTNMMIINGIFEPKTIFRYGFTLLVLASIIGIVLTCVTGWQLLVIGGLGFLLTMFYYKLKFNALGDLDIFIVFGVLIALGTSFVLTGVLDYSVLLVSAPTGLLITGILHANNTRDIENDTSANIATQASVLGVKMSRIYYVLLVGGAYVMVAVLAAVGKLSWIALAVVLSLPIAIGNIKRMAAHKQPTDISDLDGNTAKLVMIFSLLLSVANFINALVL